MIVRAHAALSAKSRLEPFEYDPGQLGPHQVDVRVTHCGICHTDAATVDNDLGISQYPLVPGHKAVGVVAAVGAEVDRLEVGQRVGVGPMCGSCMKCEWCESGLQHLCPNVELTIFGGHHGAFATHVRVNNWQFAFPLPDEIKSECAGPLMCAGATVFTPHHRGRFPSGLSLGGSGEKTDAAGANRSIRLPLLGPPTCCASRCPANADPPGPGYAIGRGDGSARARTETQGGAHGDEP